MPSIPLVLTANAILPPEAIKIFHVKMSTEKHGFIIITWIPRIRISRVIYTKEGIVTLSIQINTSISFAEL